MLPNFTLKFTKSKVYSKKNDTPNDNNKELQLNTKGIKRKWGSISYDVNKV